MMLLMTYGENVVLGAELKHASDLLVAGQDAAGDGKPTQAN